MSVIAIRHGETEWSLSGRHTGTTDIRLTENGRRLAELLGSALSGRTYALVLVSPLQRARETCELAGVAASAFGWVDRLHEAGQSWWQALPLGPTGYGDSPYQCLSSFVGNGLLISPDGLIDDGLLRATDCAGGAFSPTAVEYEKVRSVQIPLARDSVEPLQRRRSPGSPTRL
jgi:4-alpha-glucanotransferase